MKTIKHLSIWCLAAAMLAACSKPDSLELLTSMLSLDSMGGTQEMTFQTNVGWSVSSDVSWITFQPSSGSGSDAWQHVSVVVAENPDGEAREATVTLTAGSLSQSLVVKQKGQPSLTVAEFRAKKPDESSWYRLTGEIAAVADEDYGNFYIFDQTGYVYVYGLCEQQVGKGGNDRSFSKLGLKPGDTVTMMTLRSEYDGTVEAGGQTPAYFVSKTEGEYKLGSKAASTKAGWMELPATSASDKQDLLMHRFPDGTRSYAAYYDYAHLVSSWVAYPLHRDNIGSGTRTADSAFPMDPLLSAKEQPVLSKGYKEGNAGKFDRGHQIASADRLDWRVNLETFFTTNMTPQNNNLNAGIWAGLEDKVRSWARNSATDTLYVVTGCSVAGSEQYVLDNADKRVTVPTGYYKALLRLAKDKSWSAVGFWFDNAANSAASIQQSMAMSIDDLEKRVGVDFFVNLPADVQSTVEAQNPADVAWWWNN